MIFLLRKIRKKMIANKKISSYLLYAVGEVFLVVVGILIAVQIGNWNERNKNQEKNRLNTQQLIESLEKDSIYFFDLKNRFEHELEIISAFRNRLADPAMTIDTLVQIARHEFNPLMQVFFFPNDDLYYAMVQSGDINLLDKYTKQKLFSLYQFHQAVKESNNEHLWLYKGEIIRYQQSYPLNEVAFIKTGPIHDLIWESATLEDLGKKFNRLISAKLLPYIVDAPTVSRLIKGTNEMLSLLRKEQSESLQTK